MTEASAGPDSNGDPIRDYIRGNVRSMTHEAIRERLIAAGHDPKRIDEVWEQEWTGEARPSAEGALWTTSLILLAIGGLIGGAAALLLAGLNRSDNGGVIVGLFAILYAGLGLGLAWAVRRAARRWRIGNGWAFAIGVVLVPVYGLLMFGTCLAAGMVAYQTR